MLLIFLIYININEMLIYFLPCTLNVVKCCYIHIHIYKYNRQLIGHCVPSEDLGKDVKLLKMN